MASFSITKVSPCVKIHHCPNYKYALDEKFKSFKDSEKIVFWRNPIRQREKGNQSNYRTSLDIRFTGHTFYAFHKIYRLVTK